MNHDDNENLTRVGAGTLMGDLLRRYWMPLLRSDELVAGAPPLRYRLLGENLVVFRNMDGTPGLLEHGCPHRMASLSLARNEGDGLRCIYHGWKFDTQGQCIEIPSEAPDSHYCSKVRATAYSCREVNGLIWAWLGAGPAPSLPKLGWVDVPATHRGALRYQRACNWLQALEGDVDTAHLGWLHARYGADGEREIPMAASDRWAHDVVQDDRPHLELQEDEAGITVAARREHDDRSWYWRITEFLMPFHSSLPAAGPVRRAKVFVPLDDEHTMIWEPNWSDAPLSDAMRSGLEGRVLGFVPDQNDWLGRNRLLPSDTETLFGGDGLPPLQDGAIQLSMGPIVDRTREHLVASDAAIIAVRRALARAARKVRDGGGAPGADQPGAYARYGRQFTLERQLDWRTSPICS
jgi:nitrite reductase/ring-hydroxylating ferredoxin subunit